ncbi:MAG: hypothetical protein BA066_00650 [Candidatus Korarchaeota archaeon NZ13-K]|nr:MAG: hypothetical protein BA066_00650 [Candidatus Korarchaeota archaeon NZ13-K]
MRDDIEGLEERISSAVMELAKRYGFSSERSLRFISELTLAFLRGVLSSKQKFSGISEILRGEEEWRSVAFYVKRTPVCSSPCFVSHDLEAVVREYGFGDSHYVLMLKRLCGER